MSKLKVWFMVANFLFLTVTLGIYGYWMLRPYKVLDIDQPLKITNKEVSVGEKLGVRLNFCNYIATDVHIETTFVRTVGQTPLVVASIPATTTKSVIECKDIISNHFVIPKDFNPGVYHINMDLTYVLNPVRTQKIHIESEEFKVI